MTQQEYENEIKELKERLEKLEAVKIKEPQSKRWKPNENERYYTIDDNGDNCDLIWDNDRYDNWRYLIGNCFKTEEEAEEYKKQIEYTARYKNYIEEHSEPIDWCDTNQSKWFVYYSFELKNYHITYTLVENHQGTIYASSKEIIKGAIWEIGVDNFIKYVLGVK